MGTLVLFIRIVVYIVQTKAELLTGLSLKKAGLKLRKTFLYFIHMYFHYALAVCSLLNYIIPLLIRNILMCGFTKRLI